MSRAQANVGTPYGLEVNVKSTACAGWTASQAYWSVRQQRREAALSEEMRLFYVAVTRAQRMLLLLGEKADPARRGEDIHSWQQEVENAQDAMKSAGAHFGRLLR